MLLQIGNDDLLHFQQRLSFTLGFFRVGSKKTPNPEKCFSKPQNLTNPCTLCSAAFVAVIYGKKVLITAAKK
jgi:hypothetical protein